MQIRQAETPAPPWAPHLLQALQFWWGRRFRLPTLGTTPAASFAVLVGQAFSPAHLGHYTCCKRCSFGGAGVFACPRWALHLLSFAVLVGQAFSPALVERRR